jgi:hypothetical protein
LLKLAVKEFTMFVIFGTKVKTSETGHGEFFCPSCKTTRHYLQKSTARYFALYFIPLFKVETPRVYIECQVCHRVYKPELLRVDADQLKVSTLISDAEKEVRAGTPSHIIYRKLLAQHIPEALARPLSIAILGPRPRVCKSCGSLFCEQVPTCTNCGGELVLQLDPAFLEEKKAADQLYSQMIRKVGG